MKRFQQLSIAHKLSLISLLSSAVVIVAASVAFVWYQQRMLRKESVDMTSTIARMLAVDAAGALSFNDPEAAHQALRSLQMDPRVSAAAIYDATGVVFSTYQRGGRPIIQWPPAQRGSFAVQSRELDLFRDIMLHGERIGTVYVQTDLTEFHDLFLRHIAIAVLAAVTGVAASWFVASRLQRVVSEPVRDLVDVAARVADAKDYSLRAQKRTDDELGRLTDVFNDMLAQIETRDAELERRVTERTERLTAEITKRTQAQEALRLTAAAQRASEEKYRRLTEEMSDVVWEVDTENRFTYIGPAVEALAGFKPEEVIGHAVFEWFDEASKRRLEALIKDQDARDARGDPDVPIAFEGRIRRHDGTWVWIEATGRRCRDNIGRFSGNRGTMRDISARKNIEADLAQAQARLTYERDQLQALLEASPDLIYFKDLQSRFVQVSRSKAETMIQSAPRLRERRAAEPNLDPLQLVVGATDFDSFAAESAQCAYEDEQAVIRTGQPMVNKLERMVYQDGSVSWFLATKMPWRDKDGAIIGTFGISKEVTKLKQAEADLERVNRQLIDASRRAGMAEVATGVLHNVGNALNSVNVSASLVLEQIHSSRIPQLLRAVSLFEAHADDLAGYLTADPKGRKLPGYLRDLGETLQGEQQQITRELEGLRGNVEHVKEIVAMQQSYAHVSGITEPVGVTDVVEDAIRMNSAAFARHDVELVRHFAVQPIATTDRHRVLQILVNLLRNAKYACDEAHRVDKRITVSVTQHDAQVQIAVADNGVGIAAENLVRIFSHGFTTRQGGHGFGLHSAALAATELGGRLAVESPGVGQGATFTLEIPINPPAA